MTHSQVAVILNPAAGSWKRLENGDSPDGRCRLIRSWFAGLDTIELKILETRAAGDGAARAVEAIEMGCSVVAAAGGDGTVREVIAGLHSAGTGTLGVLPLGTANVLARALRIPTGQPQEAAAIVVTGAERRIDLGICGNRIFALHAGIGLDGMVVHNINPGAKRRLGRAAYILSTALASLHMPPMRIRIVPDGSDEDAIHEDAYQVFVANIPEYGGDLRLASSVDPEDGLLDLFVCRRRWTVIASALRDAIGLASGLLTQSRHVEYRQVQSVTVESAPPCWVQIDGDGAGLTPVRISCLPKAITVMVRASK